MTLIAAAVVLTLSSHPSPFDVERLATLRPHAATSQTASPAEPGERTPPGSVTVKPFLRLFQPPSPPPRTPLPPLTAPSVRPGPESDRPRVVCGTTLVPLDPGFDRAIRQHAPTRPRPSLRAQTPPPCESTRK
jgi:hypothetical protein